MTRVLVVDDEESIRFSLRTFLTDEGHDVITASHEIDARAIIDANEFDVAVVDRILTDGGNGVDIVKHLKKVQHNCESIMISAYPTFSSASKTIEHEAFAYLTKPVKKNEICQKVREAVEKGIAKKESEHHGLVLQSIFDGSPNAIIVYDLSGAVKFVNPSFSRIFGYSKDELTGKHLPDVLSDWEQEQLRAEIADLLSGKPVAERETTRLTKDGRFVDVGLTQSVCRNEKGEPTEILAVIRDITEKRKIEEQLWHVQKMETIGTLAAGISHDINNILTTITAHTEMLIDDLSCEVPAMNGLQSILKATMQARNLTTQILAFNSQIEHEPKPFEFHDALEEAIDLLRSTIPSSIEIRQDVDAACGMVFADRARIYQVIMNLCINAFHAMRDGHGVLGLSLENTEITVDGEAVKDDRYQAKINVTHLLEPGPYMRLTVSDTGHGMDKKTMERIFDPFYTTKDAGEGTGMGLSIVSGIINKCNGAISVESEPGAGSKFHVYLPVIQGSAEEKAVHRIQAAEEEYNILLVDDEEMVVNALKGVLERIGHKVTSQTSSVDALGTFRAHSHKYDLVITNFHMPRVTGMELVEKMKSIRPSIPVIFLTGLGIDINDDDVLKYGVSEYLQKPVRVADLSSAIERVFGHGTADR